MRALLVLAQALTIVAAAPLLAGFIRKVKNNLRMRHGAPLLQPYHNLRKLMGKDEVIPRYSSWIFRAAPWIVLAATVAAVLPVPGLGPSCGLSRMGDFLLILFLLALARFFLALGGLDAGSAFGGMGSSREMFISSLVEPVAVLAVLAASFAARSTSPAAIAGVAAFRLSSFAAALSFFAVTLAETSRIPVDNQETHLELTMVHEAMLLEYSGRSLALLELAAQVKQVIFFLLLVNVMAPWGIAGVPGAGIVVSAAKVCALGCLVAVVEVSVAKMRLFRVVDFLSFSLVTAFMAVVMAAAGV